MRATPHNRASEAALRIYEQVLQEIRADRLVRDAMQRDRDDLFVQGKYFDLVGYRRIFVAGVGKASVEMAAAAVSILGRVDGGLVIAKHPAPAPRGIEVVTGGHPVPDASSFRAGERMWEFAQGLGVDDLVVFVLSGGASALMELPVEGVPPEDLIAANEYLLRSGQPIGVVNAVRSRLSRLKAGGLARAFSPATVVCLVLSDVVGNHLASVGSGPLVEPRGGTDASVRFSHNEELPESVRRVLASPKGVPLDPAPPVPHFVIGSVSLAVHRAIAAAEALGLTAVGYADPMEGEAREMARRIVRLGEKTTREPYCLVFGGETTVTFRRAGKGGRCQEMAVAAAPKLSRMPHHAFLAAGTDGTDGPTDAAGALCDPDTVTRAARHGMRVQDTLAAHNSYDFLAATENLIFTGPTGTNLNDLALLVYLPG